MPYHSDEHKKIVEKVQKKKGRKLKLSEVKKMFGEKKPMHINTAGIE